MGARLRELATYLCPTTSSFKPVRYLSANNGRNQIVSTAIATSTTVSRDLQGGAACRRATINRLAWPFRRIFDDA